MSKIYKFSYFLTKVFPLYDLYTWITADELCVRGERKIYLIKIMNISAEIMETVCSEKLFLKMPSVTLHNPKISNFPFHFLPCSNIFQVKFPMKYLSYRKVIFSVTA